jgi:hypothetical protein
MKNSNVPSINEFVQASRWAKKKLSERRRVRS